MKRQKSSVEEADRVQNFRTGAKKLHKARRTSSSESNSDQKRNLQMNEPDLDIINSDSDREQNVIRNVSSDAECNKRFQHSSRSSKNVVKSLQKKANFLKPHSRERSESKHRTNAVELDSESELSSVEVEDWGYNSNSDTSRSHVRKIQKEDSSGNSSSELSSDGIHRVQSHKKHSTNFGVSLRNSVFHSGPKSRRKQMHQQYKEASGTKLTARDQATNEVLSKCHKPVRLNTADEILSQNSSLHGKVSHRSEEPPPVRRKINRSQFKNITDSDTEDSNLSSKSDSLKADERSSSTHKSNSCKQSSSSEVEEDTFHKPGPSGLRHNVKSKFVSINESSSSVDDDEEKENRKSKKQSVTHKKGSGNIKQMMSRSRPCSVRLKRCDRPGFRLEPGITVPWKRKRLKSVNKLFAEFKQIQKTGERRKFGPDFGFSSRRQSAYSESSSSSDEYEEGEEHWSEEEEDEINKVDEKQNESEPTPQKKCVKSRFPENFSSSSEKSDSRTPSDIEDGDSSESNSRFSRRKIRLTEYVKAKGKSNFEKNINRKRLKSSFDTSNHKDTTKKKRIVNLKKQKLFEVLESSSDSESVLQESTMFAEKKSLGNQGKTSVNLSSFEDRSSDKNQTSNLKHPSEEVRSHVTSNQKKISSRSNSLSSESENSKQKTKTSHRNKFDVPSVSESRKHVSSSSRDLNLSDKPCLGTSETKPSGPKIKPVHSDSKGSNKDKRIFHGDISSCDKVPPPNLSSSNELKRKPIPDPKAGSQPYLPRQNSAESFDLNQQLTTSAHLTNRRSSGSSIEPPDFHTAKRKTAHEKDHQKTNSKSAVNAEGSSVSKKAKELSQSASTCKVHPLWNNAVPSTSTTETVSQRHSERLGFTEPATSSKDQGPKETDLAPSFKMPTSDSVLSARNIMVQEELEDVKPDIQKIKLEPKDVDDFPFYSQQECVILISSDEEDIDSAFLEEIPVMPLVIKKEPELINLAGEEDHEPTISDNDDDQNVCSEDFFPELSQNILAEIEFESRQEEEELQDMVDDCEPPKETESCEKDKHDTSNLSCSINSTNFYSKPPPHAYPQFSKRKASESKEPENETFFPDLSQAFLDEIEKDERNERLQSITNRLGVKRPKVVGFTEPQPLPNRPSTSFGKGVRKKGEPSESPWLRTVPPAKPPKEKRKKTSGSEKRKAMSKLSQMRRDFKQNRVPIPGGGSDVRKPISEFKIPRVKPVERKQPAAATFNTPLVPTLSTKTAISGESSGNSSRHTTSTAIKPVLVKNQASRLNPLIEELQKSGATKPKPPSARANASLPSTLPRAMPKPASLLERTPTNIFAKPISTVFPNVSHSQPTETSTTRNTTLPSCPGVGESKPNPRRVHFNSVTNYSDRTLNTKQVPNRNSSANVAAFDLSRFQEPIHQIVSWNRRWLEEQKNLKASPPVVSQYVCKKVSYSYSSVEEYCSRYYPLLVYEMWSSLFSQYKESQSEPNFKVRVETSLLTSNRLTELHCKIRVDANVQHPNQSPLELREGMVLEVKSKGLYLGYVFFVRHEPSPEPAYKILKFGLYMKGTNVDLDPSKNLTLTKIGNVKSFIRQAESLVHLSRSDLAPGILNPELITGNVNVDPRIKLQVSDQLNPIQKTCIMHTVSAVYQVPEKPQVVLIQGPPGTGKTFLITGMIQELLLQRPDKKQPCRLLVVAPSNAAVDEIGCRLIRLRKHCHNVKIHPPNFVRVGQLHMVHPDVKAYTPENLCTKYKRDQGRKREECVQRISEVSTQIYNVRSELNRQRSDPLLPPEHIRLKEEHLHNLQQRKQLLENDVQALTNLTNSVRQQRRNLLEKADIILSTLNSCRQNIPEDFRFTCCIVDEATQCSEPELLSPILAFHVTKFVLVGDPQQLPATVKSVEASEFGYTLSMFERMFHKVKHDPRKIYMLKEQYRMHEEICSFPSREFYSGRLSTKYKSVAFPLRPYILFDLKDSQENNDPSSSSISNNREANFVTELCCELLDVTCNKYSIGIITPYRDQVKQIACKLGNYKQIEVNTVDGFQGREKDIIVLSCVRSNFTGNIGFLNNRNRLNVALTRASHCLIICGNLLSLSMKDGTWQRLIKDAQLRRTLHTTTSSVPVKSLVERFIIKQ